VYECVVLFAGVWHTAAKKLGKKEQRGAGKLKPNPRKMEINSLILFYNFIVKNV